MFATEVSRERVELLLRVARLYYVDRLDQSGVAREIGYSRTTVSRLLDEARERGIVTVQIAHPIESAIDCEHRLRQRFGLDSVAVASDRGGEPSVAVGGIAARLIGARGGDDTVIALSNGTSVAAVVASMPRQRWRGSCVVQMIGTLGAADTMMVDSPELCRTLADRLGGVHRPLPVPIVTRNGASARAMLREEAVLTTLELAARSDIAVCGIGTVGPTGTSGRILHAFMTPEIDAEVRKGHAVAHLCGHHFDVHGRHVRTSLCERLMTLRPERLADIPTSLAAVWGRAKVPAIHAVLKTGFLNALATDEATARAVLDYRP